MEFAEILSMYPSRNENLWTMDLLASTTNHCNLRDFEIDLSQPVLTVNI